VKRKHIFFGVMGFVFLVAFILICIFALDYAEMFAYIFSFTVLVLGFLKWLIPRWNVWMERIVI
jgi:hypothetical protein